jgi:hypothetical protein
MCEVQPDAHRQGPKAADPVTTHIARRLRVRTVSPSPRTVRRYLAWFALGVGLGADNWAGRQPHNTGIAVAGTLMILASIACLFVPWLTRRARRRRERRERLSDVHAMAIDNRDRLDALYMAWERIGAISGEAESRPSGRRRGLRVLDGGKDRDAGLPASPPAGPRLRGQRERRRSFRA